MSKIFRFLTEDDHKLLLESAQKLTYQKDDLIVEEGSRHQAIYIIEQGIVRVERAHMGNGVAFARMGKGKVFGEMAFLENTGASANIVAEDHLEVMVIEAPELYSLLTSVPGLSARFYQSIAITLSQRLRETTSMIPPLMVEEVPQVNRFHATRTGYLPPQEDIPLDIIHQVDIFKSSLAKIDGELKEARLNSEEAQEQVNEYSNLLVDALNRNIISEPEREKAIGAYVFRETFSLFMMSSILDRSFAKPRGYAGDYFTLELIYRNHPVGDGRLGPLIDKWALNLPAAQAVQNRREFLTSAIKDIYSNWNKEWAMPVTSLASGPARELFDLFGEPSPPYLHMTCIDIDSEALSFTSETAFDIDISKHMNFCQDNLIHLAKGRGKTVLMPQQIIYSVGLIDYLGDDEVVDLLNWIFDNLLPGGQTIIGNFDVSNPNKLFMDHILEWELIHRSSSDLKRLFEKSNFQNSQVTVHSEDAGVNLFAFCSREA